MTTEPLFGGSGVVTNIPFEQRRSDVTEYTADYWLLSKDRRARESKQFDYLLYNQVILLKILVTINNGGTTKEYVFPHVTSNVVKRVPGTPTQARGDPDHAGVDGREASLRGLLIPASRPPVSALRTDRRCDCSPAQRH